MVVLSFHLSIMKWMQTVLFFNHEGSVPLHYGGIVAVITMLLESGYLKRESPINTKLKRYVEYF